MRSLKRLSAHNLEEFWAFEGLFSLVTTREVSEKTHLPRFHNAGVAKENGTSKALESRNYFAGVLELQSKGSHMQMPQDVMLLEHMKKTIEGVQLQKISWWTLRFFLCVRGRGGGV